MMECKFKKNELIMKNYEDDETKIYFIVSVKGPDVILRDEKTDELIQVETHYINREFSKVDPEILSKLYKEEENEKDDSDDANVNANDITSEPRTKSSSN